MYKISALLVLLLGLALAPVLSGGIENKREQLQQSVGQTGEASAESTDETLSPAEVRACEWQCQPCESDEGCSQTCVEVGDCGSICSVVAQCDEKHLWDDASCTCVAAW